MVVFHGDESHGTNGAKQKNNQKNKSKINQCFFVAFSYSVTRRIIAYPYVVAFSYLVLKC